MTQKASTYQPICLARLPLLRNTKLRWMGKSMHSPMTIAIIVLHQTHQRPHNADDPEAFGFQHRTIHELIPDHTIGRLGKASQGHIVLEQDVQIGLALLWKLSFRHHFSYCSTAQKYSQLLTPSDSILRIHKSRWLPVTETSGS